MTTKISRLGLQVFLTLIFFTAFASAATIITTDVAGNIKTDFSPNELVYVRGTGFSANALVTVKITRPNSVVDTGFAITNNLGKFVYVYQLNGIKGDYLVVASDGTHTATVTFTDAAIWTTDSSCGDSSQDQNHYNIGDHVHINGDGFNAGSYNWTITGKPGGASCDPNIVVASGTRAVNSSGAFCFDAYTVQIGDCGEYQVKFDVKGDNYRVVGNTCTNNASLCGVPSSELTCQGTNIVNVSENPACVGGQCQTSNSTTFVRSCGNTTSSLTCFGNNLTRVTNIPGCSDATCFNTTIVNTTQICPIGNSTIKYCVGNLSVTNLTTFGGCSAGNCVNNTQTSSVNCQFGCREGYCIQPQCGNNITETNEQCDDGNNNNGDGCNAQCQLEFCGDGIIQPNLNEECEPPNTLTCNAQCQEIIQQCEHDSDGDGVCDPDDMCPNSKPNEPVDEDGCDPFQFCSSRSCSFDCFTADWRNNEPGVYYPQDCTVVIPEVEGQLQQPICVPTVATPLCFA